MSTKQLPDWLLVDFAVKRVPDGFLIMDGRSPVSSSPFMTLKAAEGCRRELQQRREALRVEMAAR